MLVGKLISYQINHEPAGCSGINLNCKRNITSPNNLADSILYSKFVFTEEHYKLTEYSI